MWEPQARTLEMSSHNILRGTFLLLGDTANNFMRKENEPQAAFGPSSFLMECK